MAEQRGQQYEATSLDVLVHEDETLRDIFGQIRRHHEPIEVASENDRAASIQRRYRYGISVKQALRHLAVCQSSAMDVAGAIDTVPSLRGTAAGLRERRIGCRALINELRDVTRTTTPMGLNVGQHFDERLAELIAMAEMTISWELDQAIPTIEKELGPRPGSPPFRSAHYVRVHAPTKLNPSGPRWYERAPVVSRVLTAWDHFVEAQVF